MTEYTMSATLDAGKNLVFSNVPMQNQDENCTTTLSVTVPSAMANGADFYLEFSCPHGKNYVSPLLTKTTSGNNVVVSYSLPKCVLAHEGTVLVQLVARSSTDNTICYKSVKSGNSAFYVNSSVEASEEVVEVDDFLANASQKLAELNQALTNREGTALPLMDGTASAGTNTKFARCDHVHPTDTSRLSAKPDGTNNLLDSDNKIQQIYLPSISTESVKYKGTWNANSTTAVATNPQKGWYYICQTGGSYHPDGTANGSYTAGDWAVYNGSSWDKVDNTDNVTMVNGQKGNVVTYKNWTANTTFYSGDFVANAGKLYLCTAIFTSGTTFATAINGTTYLTQVLNGTDKVIGSVNGNSNANNAIYAPTSLGSAGQVLATNSQANGLAWVNPSGETLYRHNLYIQANKTIHSGGVDSDEMVMLAINIYTKSSTQITTLQQLRALFPAYTRSQASGGLFFSSEYDEEEDAFLNYTYYPIIEVYAPANTSNFLGMLYICDEGVNAHTITPISDFEVTYNDYVSAVS